MVTIGMKIIFMMCSAGGLIMTINYLVGMPNSMVRVDEDLTYAFISVDGMPESGSPRNAQ
jgi:hypothetical protein